MEKQIASLILDVVPKLVREIRSELRRAPHDGLTIPQFRILTHLASEPANNKSLAEALGVSVPASSRMVKCLVQKKLVESAQSSSDKREVLLRLTQKGEQHLDQIQASLRGGLAKRMNQTSKQNMETTEKGLMQLKLILEELQER